MLASIRGFVSLYSKRSIEVWEWKQSDVMLKRLPNNSDWTVLAKLHAPMTFSPFRLAHAVVKADFLDPRNLILPGVGFLLQADRIVDFRHKPDFRLVKGGAKALADFSATSLCGRLAQGLALIYANTKGYAFVAHLKSHLIESGLISPSGKGVKAADFLFENESKKRIIVESKGSFANKGNDPTNVKGILKPALKHQVMPWVNKMAPAKGYVFLSHVRETGQKEKSAFIFVDPPGDQITDHFDVPADWVKRQNYAAWLTSMGMPQPARRLRERVEYPLRRFQLPVYTIGRWKIATSPYYHPAMGFGPGIEVNVLRTVSEARSGNVQRLIEFGGLEAGGEDEMRGSLMADGTYFGPLRRRDFFDLQEFVL